MKAQPARAVLNAMSILESFDLSHAAQSLAGISRRLGIPKATALRTMLALETRGYVVLDPEGRKYSLAEGVLALAQAYLARYEALAVARPALAELAGETGETAHFAVLQGTQVVYLEIAESPQRVRAYVLRGDHLPAHCVAAGKAILAHGGDGPVQAVLAQGLARLTPATVDRAAFLQELRLARQRGYALNLGEWMEDVAGVSAPILGNDGRVHGAIGVAGPMSRLNARNAHDVGGIVLRYADRISARLGGSRGDNLERQDKPPAAAKPARRRRTG